MHCLKLTYRNIEVLPSDHLHHLFIAAPPAKRVLWTPRCGSGVRLPSDTCNNSLCNSLCIKETYIHGTHRTYAVCINVHTQRCSSASIRLCEWNLWRTNSCGEAAECGGKDNYNDTRTYSMQRDYANVKRFLGPACRVRSKHVGAV